MAKQPTFLIFLVTLGIGQYSYLKKHEGLRIREKDNEGTMVLWYCDSIGGRHHTSMGCWFLGGQAKCILNTLLDNTLVKEPRPDPAHLDSDLLNWKWAARNREIASWISPACLWGCQRRGGYVASERFYSCLPARALMARLRIMESFGEISWWEVTARQYSQRCHQKRKASRQVTWDQKDGDKRSRGSCRGHFPRLIGSQA